MIRIQTSHLAHARSASLLVRLWRRILCWKKSFRTPAIYRNFTKCCTCHQKWHLHFTKYCTCHKKWLSNIKNSQSNISKCCTCHEKLHSDITKATKSDSRMCAANDMKINFLGWVGQQGSPSLLYLSRQKHFDQARMWNVIYNVQRNRTHPQTSPKLPLPRKMTLIIDLPRKCQQCAEQQHPPSNITKYCTWHEKWQSKIWRKAAEDGWNVIYNAGRFDRPCSEKHIASQNVTKNWRSRNIFEVEMSKIARRCNEKHIARQNVIRTDGLGALFQVEMWWSSRLIN